MKMKKFWFLGSLIVIMVIFTLNTFAYTNKIVLPDEWPSYGLGDPYVLKFNGNYYLYVSTKDDQVGIKCWSSTNLVNWIYKGLCATDTRTKGAYAPEVIYWNGTFYMYISPLGQGHYVLSSSSPTGPFTIVTGNLGHSIDGSVFINDDGSMYFYHADVNGIMGHAMSSPTAIGSDVLLAGTRVGAEWTEGPCMIKRNGTYYLTYTGNHVHSKGYRVDYSKNTAGPLAAFTKPAQNPIILNTEGSFVGIGHSSSFIGPDLDTYYITYHNYEGKNAQGWPIRHLNFDPLGFNGDKMVVYGPTDFSQPNPGRPVFEDWFYRSTIGGNWTNVNGGTWGIAATQDRMTANTVGNSAFCMELAASIPSTNYTAECNVKEVYRGTVDNTSRLGVVFNYVNSTNYGIMLLSSMNNRVETNFLVNNVWAGAQYTALPPGYDYQKWHTLRIEKSGTTFKFFVDGMLKQTRTNSLGVGKLGYLSTDNNSEFGYFAYNNQVNGSAIFDAYKPIPGILQAVHYNTGGEGIGYHDTTSGNTGGKYIRADNVDIRDCPEGGENIGWNATGEWYKYNINVKSAGIYNVGIRYATTFSACKVRIWFDSTDVTGIVSIPATGGWDNWRTFTIKGLNFTTAGNHTMKVETVEGEYDFYTFTFYAADNSTFSKIDSFATAFSADWNYTDGIWAVESGMASIADTGKRTMGSTGWSDYIIEADLKPMTSTNIDGGIIFRVTNPAQGGAGNDPLLGSDFFQGYYAGLSGTAGVVLGKQNYNWTLLTNTAGSYTVNNTYHMKVVVSGNNIKVYVVDMVTPKINYTDNNTPFINGKVGIRSHISHFHFDNFKVTH